MMPQRRLAAVFIDFENIYYYLKNETIVEDKTNTIVSLILDAYADFEQLDEDAQGDLYLVGVETHNVLGTAHKNAADMKLCIAAMEMLYTRPNIESSFL